MEAHEVEQMKQLFARLATMAKEDPAAGRQVRDALVESGLLEVFGSGETLDLIELLDLGGENILRMRLSQMTLAELKQIVRARNYDPEGALARSRSVNKFVDLIVAGAQKELEEELAQEATPAGWML